MATRIFPYYKDKYLGKSEFGYTTIQNAKKRMDVTMEMVLNHYGMTLEEYKENNKIAHPVLWDKKYAHSILVRENSIYDEDIHVNINNKYLTEDQIKEIEEIEKLFHKLPSTFAGNYEVIEKISSKIKDFQDRTGIFPRIYIDWTYYEQLRKKFIKEVVNYVEKEIVVLD